MRQIGVAILSLVLVVTAFSDALVYLAFKVHQQEITDSLCININTPEVMCSGSCYLTDKLSEDKQADQSRAALLKESKPTLVLFLSGFPPLLTTSFQTAPCLVNPWEDQFIVSHHSSRLFRPPRS